MPPGADSLPVSGPASTAASAPISRSAAPVASTVVPLTQPAVVPIFQTSAFDVPDLDTLALLARGEAVGHIYTRDSNPNHAILAESIAALEQAESGAVFASGMGALSSIFLALAGAGDHVVIARALYGRTRQLAETLQQRWGLQLTVVDGVAPENFRRAVTERTRFVLVETVSNPLLEVADIGAIAAALGKVPLVVDSTFTTPELIRPCQCGAAIVMHSASKYLNGHGDVMLGVAAGSAALMQRLGEATSVFGFNANPFEAWLCLRGMRTLSLRMRQICHTTRQLAELLGGHPAVRRVHYPLLAGHPSRELAERLYPDGPGGIVSFELLSGGAAAVNRFMQHSRGIPFTPTLADVRTTISWPAGTSHRFVDPDERRGLGITDELIRLSVGLEPFDQIASELTRSLDLLRS